MPNPTKPKAKCALRGCTILVKRVSAKFCCQAHQHEHQYREWVKRWLAGDENGITGNYETARVSETIRRYLVDKHGEKCKKCGWAERHPVTGKVPVQIDHKDGNGFNNRPNNVRLLCPNCHSLTITFCALNKGRGRKARLTPTGRIKKHSKPVGGSSRRKRGPVA